MFCQAPTFSVFVLAALTGLSDAYWRMLCGTVQTGRIDPIVAPGQIASHVHKIAGGSHIGTNATYDDLLASDCTSCEISADKSAYWTPLLYYQHSNGSFEEVPNASMTVYYIGRGDNRTSIQPFPPGFRMLSGSTNARSYDSSTLTYNNVRPISDRVSFACLDTNSSQETPSMSRTNCANGLRAQIQFQSCWDGVNLYKPDNSHVAYMSQIDNGACPPGYPVQLVHLFFEVLYGVNNINLDGGLFVFGNGDTTGYGFHGDFLNGWEMDVQTAALSQCANTDNGGQIGACPPLAAVDNPESSNNCPEQPPLINEPVHGMISKLPGCITITSGPGAATFADMTCPANFTQPTMNAPPVSLGPPSLPAVGTVINGWRYMGCANDTSGGRALSAASFSNSSTMTNEACQSFCATKGYPVAGTEYGSECYCGPSLGLASTLNQTCSSMLCAGNSSQYCGGPQRLNVWTATNFTTSATSSSSTAPLTTLAISTRPATSTSTTTFAATITPGTTLGAFTYLGCANEVSGRALTNASFSNTTGMTNDACGAYCAAQNYALFGTEYAQECYCGNALAAGSSLPSTGCSAPCKGAPAQICGGSSRLSVYNMTQYRPAAVVDRVGAYVSQGCWSEGSGGRALGGASYTDKSNMTVEGCVGFCAGKGFAWAGVEWAQECYCASAVGRGAAKVAGGCDMLCKGSMYEYCGGSARLNVYSNA